MIGKEIEQHLPSRNYDRLLNIEEFNASTFEARCHQNHNGDTLILNDSKTSVFKIGQFGLCQFSADLSENDYQKLYQILTEKKVVFDIKFLPAGYFKDQRQNLFRVTLNVFGETKAVKELTLLSFGYSFGEILINGIQVGLSHSGGSFKDETVEEFQAVNWIDYTTVFTFCGKNAFKALSSIADNL